MSQFWHANWAEDSFKPTRLGNWQVPNWHPKWPCFRHCATTTFLADKSGRLLPNQPRSKRSPWGNYKGTWELPLKINKKLAHKLSAPPEYKLAAWQAHKNRYEGPCGVTPSSPKRTDPSHTTKQQKPRKIRYRDVTRVKKTNTETKRKAIGKVEAAKNKKATTGPEKHKNEPKNIVKRVLEEPVEDEEENSIEKLKNYEKTIPKEADKIDQDIKKDNKIECHCVLRTPLPVEIPKPKHYICTIHRRLRV